MRNILILTLAVATGAAIIGYNPPADPIPLPRPRPDFEHAFSAFDGKPIVILRTVQQDWPLETHGVLTAGQPLVAGHGVPAWANGSFGYYGPVLAAPVVARGK